MTGQPQLRMARFLTALLGGRTDRWGEPTVRTSACDLAGYTAEVTASHVQAEYALANARTLLLRALGQSIWA